IEDTRQSPIELGETEDTVPTYHWSEIHSPRLNDLTTDIFNDEVVLTQKVNIKNETPKVHSQRAGCVIYDFDFLRYKLLEVIAPIICNHKNELIEKNTNTEDALDALDDLGFKLTGQLAATIFSSVRYHDEAMAFCDEAGVELSYSPKALLRSFKSAKTRAYKKASDKFTEE
ncbi:hypothetical protein, partial [Microcoleus sp. Aus8_D3]